MPIPNYQAFMQPLVSQIADGRAHSLAELKKTLCNALHIDEEQRAETIASSGNRTVVSNRLGWARTYLHKAGLLSIPKPGFVQITDRGQQALQSGQPINNAYLKQFPEFLEFIRPAKDATDASADTAKTTHEDDTTPDEQIKSAWQTLNSALAEDLIELVKKQTPQFFEVLVVQMMQAMGYGGWSKDSGSATQYTGDGGIDGIINEDPLGLETIYLQAKRYTDAAVGRPDIQAFVGALEMKRARKGVFITTSRFSRDALDYVSLIEKKVVLIDGKQLAELMIKHNLGVSVKETYQVKAIDSDYFAED